ncbi:MAG: sulfatase-like hydrolase/transferase [Verrucomicrobiota bacterium]
MPKWNPSVACLFVGLACLTNVDAAKVLLIIADDLGRDSLAVYNDEPSASIPPTPAIDSLAANGILFNRAYAYGTCSPTRASILTGRYDFRTGVDRPEGPDLKANEFTLAEAIVESGVIGSRLAQIGKWHLGSDPDAPNDHGGWPHYAGMLGGGVPNYYSWTKTVNGTNTSRYTVYTTTDIVDDAIDWIEDQGTEDWFLWVAFNAPHSPFHLPPNDLHDYDHLDGSDADVAANPRPYYEAMVQAMDTEISRLLESIDLADTTVIFMGDNGTPGQVVQYPFVRGHAKGSLYEGGVNIPLIIAGQSIPPSLEGSINQSIVHSVDLYRTILDLFGVDPGVLPQELAFDSRSFHAVLTGASDSHTRTFAYSSKPGSAGGADTMLVNADHKWIVVDGGAQEFYTLADGLEEDTDYWGALDQAQFASYQLFLQETESLQNIPEIFETYLDDQNQFTLELGWFANAQLTLQTRSHLFAGDWEEVASFTMSDDSGSVYYLRDNAPFSGTQFYRVVIDEI